MNPSAREAEESMAYELALQCGWLPPGAVALPLGSVARVVASSAGFREALASVGWMLDGRLTRPP